jgi:hypothetical protein
MEKYLISQNIITSNGCFLSGRFLPKKSINFKYNTISEQKKLPSYKRITYFPVRNKRIDLALTNRHIDEDHSLFNSTNCKTKSRSIIIKNKLCNYNDLKNYSFEEKNHNHINIINKSQANKLVQQNLMDEEEKHYNDNTIHQNTMINFLLNEKMKIYPKLQQTKIKKRNIIDDIKHFYGEGIFLAKYEKKFLQNSKPIQYYFRIKNKSKNYAKIMRNMSDYLQNKSKYEILHFNNKKEKLVTRLLLDESENKFDKDFNSNLLMKFPQSSRYSNLCNDRINKGFIQKKLKLGKINNSHSKDNIINKQNSFDNIKLLSKKGYKDFEKNRFKGFNKKLRETLNDVKINRQKYEALAEMQLNIFIKNKNEIFSNNKEYLF